MNISQMKQFKVIAETQNMRKSSEILYISTPVLSRLIKNIETEFGHDLFDRYGRNIVLNKYGKQLLESINIILDEYDNISLSFGLLDNAPPSIKFVGMFEMLLSAIVGTFPQQHPDISIDIQPASCEDALNALLQDESDIIFTDNFALEKIKGQDIFNNVISTYMIKNNLCLAVPKHHKFANMNKIDLEELIGERILSPSIGDGDQLIEFVNRVCNKKSIKLNLLFYNNILIRRITYSTPYIRIANSFSHDFFHASLEYVNFVRIDAESAYQEIYLCYKKGNKNVELFVDHIKNTFYSLFKTKKS